MLVGEVLKCMYACTVCIRRLMYVCMYGLVLYNMSSVCSIALASMLY